MTHNPDESYQIIHSKTNISSAELQRIKDRGRSEETGIPIEYLQQLEQLHDDWLLDNPKTILLNGENRWTAEEVVERILASVR